MAIEIYNKEKVTKYSELTSEEVKSIINYAHSADKKVILEGIETHEDLQLAQQLKCDFVQGFYYHDSFKNVS